MCAVTHPHERQTARQTAHEAQLTNQIQKRVTECPEVETAEEKAVFDNMPDVKTSKAGEDCWRFQPSSIPPSASEGQGTGGGGFQVVANGGVATNICPLIEEIQDGAALEAQEGAGVGTKRKSEQAFGCDAP